MRKLKAFIAESVSPKEFYDRDWEGHVAEEIVRLLDGKASYRIVLNAEMLRRAITSASENAYDVFHLSCHGSKKGVRLTDNTRLSWGEVADCFQKAAPPKALILSSCVGGDGGIARAFEERKRRPQVILGPRPTTTSTCLPFPAHASAGPSFTRFWPREE